MRTSPKSDLEWLRPLAMRVDGLIHRYGLSVFRSHLTGWSVDYRLAVDGKDRWRKKQSLTALANPASESDDNAELVDVYTYREGESLPIAVEWMLAKLPAELRDINAPKIPPILPDPTESNPDITVKFVALGAIRDVIEGGEKIDIFPEPGVSLEEFQRRKTYPLAMRYLGDYLKPFHLSKLSQWCDDIEHELKLLRLPYLRHWANRLTTAWQRVSEDSMPFDDQWRALKDAVSRGWVVLRLHVRYWSLPYQRAANARCTVRGAFDGVRAIESEIRKAIPEWAAMPIQLKVDPEMEAALTDHGLQVLREIEKTEDSDCDKLLNRSSDTVELRLELELLKERTPLLRRSKYWHRLSGADAAADSSFDLGTGPTVEFNRQARWLRIASASAHHFLNRENDVPPPVVAFIITQRVSPVKIGEMAATCYCDAAWTLFCRIDRAIGTQLNGTSRSVYERLDLTAQQIKSAATEMKTLVCRDQSLEQALQEIKLGIMQEFVKANAQPFVPDDLEELHSATKTLCERMGHFLVSIRAVEADLAGLVPAPESFVPKPPGWKHSIVPSTIRELAEWFKLKVRDYREYPNDGGYWEDHVTVVNGMNHIRRAPNPRMVSTRLEWAKSAVNQVHFWLEDRDINGQPDRPVNFDDLELTDCELSKLLKFLLRLSADRNGEVANADAAVDRDADLSDMIDKLEALTPSLNKTNGEWVNNKRAASLEGIEARTLSSYRSKGAANDDGNFGRDNDGRVWRREGTPKSHPWYLRSTLVSFVSVIKNRR